MSEAISTEDLIWNIFWEFCLWKQSLGFLILTGYIPCYNAHTEMKIIEKTYVSEILKEHGDIAEIMEIFGVKRVGGPGFKNFLTWFITVKTAAFVHVFP